MSVKFTSNIREIKSNNERNTSLAIRFMADAIDEQAFPFTPKRKGNLRSDILKQVLGKRGIIIWQKEYARRQEEVLHQRYTTPGTGPHFAENSVKKVVDTSEIYFRKAGVI